MPLYKKTNTNQGRVVITQADLSKNASVTPKDSLHLVTADEVTSKVIPIGFRFDMGLYALEVYLNGQLLRCRETILGVNYGDYTESTNYSITFEDDVLTEGDQLRFRVNASAYDRSNVNSNNIQQLAKDLYGRDSSTGLLWGDGRITFTGQVNALAYKSSIVSGYDYRHNGTISNAISIIGSNTRILYFTSGDWLINANITFPSNIGVRVEMGTKFIVQSGYTLTFSGPFEAGLYQVFDLSAGGTLSFGTNSINIAQAEWWGLTNFDSSTQSTLPNRSIYIGSTGILMFKDSSGSEHSLY